MGLVVIGWNYKRRTKNVGYRIMKTLENGNCVMYRAACECGEPNHDMVLDVEIGEDLQQVELHFYVTLGRWAFGETNWFVRQWKKLKYATRILFTGTLQIECDFLMGGKRQIEGLIGALEESCEKLSAMQKPK